MVSEGLEEGPLFMSSQKKDKNSEEKEGQR